jgi:cytochrome P450
VPPGAIPFDPLDAEFIADPYPIYAKLRTEAEIHQHELLGQPVTVSHRACSAVLRSPVLQRSWTDREPASELRAFNMLHQNSMLETSPPRHTRLRRLVAAAFNRGHTERLRPTVQAIADRLVSQLADQIAARGSADLVETVAGPLPTEVIAELLGVPASDRGLLRPWSNAIVKMYEYGTTPDRRTVAERAATEFVEYLRALVADRQARPGEDLVTDLVSVSGDGALTTDEVIGTAALLLMAGHEATVNVLGNGMLALLTHRHQWRRLRREPDLLPLAVEELIRFDAPLQIFERTATADVEIAGYRVPAGQKIAALLGAAARDPAVFPDQDNLDIGRQPNPHLGFGMGLHYCLGAPLARVEVQAALQALTTLLPRLRLGGEPVRRPEFAIRGLSSLPVTG